MSGNSVALAIYSAQANWRSAFAHACPLIAFFPGLILGAALVEGCRRAKLRAPLMPAMLVEAALLLLFLLAARHPHDIEDPTKSVSATYITAVALLALSMGLQNGALRQVGALSNVHTYVTGTLLATARGLTEFLFWIAPRLRRLSKRRLRRIIRSATRQRSLRTAGFAALLWVLYVIGGVAGTLLLLHAGIGAILVPVAVLLVIAVVDLAAPVARTEG